ncbi:MAG: hypothetical protein AAGB06_05855 [Verrucomicrobiota bacterium]
MKVSINEALLIVNGRGGELGLENQPSLSEALVMLDSILDLQRENIPSQLVHYLERRSYQKALAYVETHSVIL